ncbi:MAG: hypothetical protein V1735_01445 [Nanoarchaeota archaeon]
MKTLDESYQALQASKEFTDWKPEHPDAFLCNAFTIMDEANQGLWQLGFYDKASEHMTSFAVGDRIMVESTKDIFMEPGTVLQPLEYEKATFTAEQALAEARALQDREYAGNRPFRVVMLLQNTESRLRWNVTFITGTFNTLNMHFDAASGQTIKHELISVIKPFGK